MKSNQEHGLKNLRTIHRLDRLTSGLLMFGRCQDSIQSYICINLSVHIDHISARCFFKLFFMVFSFKLKKKLAQPMGSFFTLNFVSQKVALVGCNLFFILELKIGRTS